ncbi:hypothetical protein [Kluyvera ascorbata]|uniref:hypothetical protein n=1 Tax=Kluyvera ascorbata TaxID=51288 RepID=UPI0039F6FDCE
MLRAKCGVDRFKTDKYRAKRSYLSWRSADFLSLKKPASQFGNANFTHHGAFKEINIDTAGAP